MSPTSSPPPKRVYPKKFERHPTQSIEITERDVEILAALGRCRILKPCQVHRLVSPESGKQTIQRRLKKLFHAGFVDRIPSFVREGTNSDGILHVLDVAGADLLRSRGLREHQLYKNQKLGHLFVQHILELADFRITMELATKDHSLVQMDRFVSDFELSPLCKKTVGRDRFAVYESFLDHRRKKRRFLYPDALVVLSARSNPRYRLLLFVEIDRGTEKLSTIREKLSAYSAYFENEIVAMEDRGILRGYQSSRHGQLFAVKVLFQVPGKRRALNVLKCLDETGILAANSALLITERERVTPEQVLSGAIWLDEHGKRRSLLKT